MALTQAEVNAALDSQPGLNWTITGAYPQSWETGTSLDGIYLSVRRYTDTDRSSYELRTTVTGPGVLELSRYSDYYISTSIFLDGIQNGWQTPWTQYSPMRDRVVIPPGTHSVSWKSTFGMYASYSRFSNAKWLPGRVDLPVQLGANGSGITLSGPWAGQDIWHRGDGGAAWSGLVPPVRPGSTPTSNILRGEFTGDGVLSFRCMPRGGPGRVRLDGGAWRALSGKDVWTHHHLRAAGSGPHVVEFDIPSLVSNDRAHSEMLVDELALLPVVDFSTALDTPDLAWTPTFTQYGTLAYGAALEGTRGGAVVVLDQSHITTRFPQSALLKVRTLGDVQFIYEGSYIGGGTILSSETTPEGDWKIRAVELNHAPTGNGELTLYSHAAGMADYIEVVEKPASLEAAVGMPPGTFRTGGDVPWQVLPVTSLGTYAARPVFTRDAQSGWMEHDVTGPAEILLQCYTREQDFRVRVDGRVTWAGGTNNYRQPVAVRIEVPAGQHVVRYESGIADNSFLRYDSETWISSMTVNVLPPGGITAAALDFSSPYGTSGTWTVAAAPSPVASTALAPKPVAYGSEEKPVLTFPLTGPGYFRWASHIATGAYSSPVVLNTSFNQSFQRAPYSSGWSGHGIWVPAGEHVATITAPEGTVKHLDGFSFTPSEYLPVEELVSGETTPLTASPADQPWTGMRKQADEPPVIMSPMIEKNAPKKLSMTANGPGRISFKWKNVNRAAGSFFINGAPSPLTLRHDSAVEESETLFIDAEGPLILEWQAKFEEYGSYSQGWLELRDIVWIPIVATPLAEALDAPAGTLWTTSPEHPFQGYPTPGAVGGTAANVVLKIGEESWLETTVEGPGVFSLAMLDSIAKPYGPATGYAWVVLEIDGEDHWFGSFDGPGTGRHLILDGGTHTIRVKFSVVAWKPEAVVAMAVDAVTWTPAAATDPGPEWTADAPGSLGWYPGMSERNNKDLMILHPLAGGPQWIERSVTGPGLLTWESRKTPGMTIRRDYTLSIDGVGVTGLPATTGTHGENVWEKYELHVPPGAHTVRFAADTAPPVVPSSPQDDPPPSWQISGMAFAPGETDLMKGIDSMAMPWLGFQPGYSELMQGNGAGVDDDYFYANSTIFRVINASPERLLATTSIVSSQPGHQPGLATRLLPPWSAVEWYPDYGQSSYDAFVTEAVSVVSMDEALDIPTTAGDDGGWQGLATTTAHDGVDAAFSLLEADEATATLTRSVTGPARVRFRWKHTAAGRLTFSIDGQAEPVETTDGWTEVEHYVNAGTHVLGWSHHGLAGAQNTPAAAWVDALVIEPLPQRTLDEAAGGPGFTLATTSPGTDGGWQANFRKSIDGEWVDLATTRSGDAVMSTTITGPAVLTFHGHLTQVAPYTGTSPLEGPFLISDYIQVKVGGADKVSVRSWFRPEEQAIHIPAGTHQVTWQMMSEYITLDGLRFTAPYTGVHVEAAVDDISITTPQAHYDAWVQATALPSGKSVPRDDADGDGVINYLEYAFRTSPTSALDRPFPPWIYLSSSYINVHDPAMVVHLDTYDPPAHVRAELQQSHDLVTWTKVELGGPSHTWGLPGDSFLYLEFPVPADGKPLFFRYEIDLPEETD